MGTSDTPAFFTSVILWRESKNKKKKKKKKKNNNKKDRSI
jgi:hypothetical protein